MLDWNCWKSNSSSTSTSDRATAATAINVTRFIWKEVRVTCMTCRIYDFWQLNYDDIFFSFWDLLFHLLVFCLFCFYFECVPQALVCFSYRALIQPSIHFIIIGSLLARLLMLSYFLWIFFICFVIHFYYYIFYLYIYFFFVFLCFSRSLWRNTDISLNFMIWKYFISFLVASTKFFSQFPELWRFL